jgi:hypothetical protein
MLLNLLRTRDGDTGVFLDVGQIVAGYTIESVASASAAWNLFGFSIPHPNVPNNVVTGSVDMVLRLMVTIVNGISNRYGGDLRARAADPEFYPLLARMRRVQLSGGIGMRVQRVEQDEAILITFRKNVDPAIEEDVLAIRLDPAGREFRIVYGSVPSSDREVALLTRSALEVLVDLSSFITVPETHVADERVGATAEPEMGPTGPIRTLLRVSSGKEPPSDASVAVPYRDYWFWIDDRDMASKRMFSFIMFIFTLVEPGTKAQAPVLTIPTG